MNLFRIRRMKLSGCAGIIKKFVIIVFIFFIISSSGWVLPSTRANQLAPSYLLDETVDITGETYTSINAVAVGDADNDGKNEIIVNYAYYISWETSPIEPATVFLEWTGTQYAVEDTITGFTMLGRPGSMVQGVFHITVGDTDNDGLNEVLMPGELKGSEGIYLYEHSESGYQLEWAAVGPYADGEIYDINMDGLNEVIIPGYGVYQWTGTDYVRLCQLASAEGIRIGDMDGDGEEDVVLTTGALGISVYRWEDGVLVHHGSFTDTAGYISCGFGVGDADGDGKDEALRVEYHNTIYLIGWNGNYYIKEWQGQSPQDDNPVTAWIGDSDDDGLGELFVGNGNYVYGISVLQYEFSGGSYSSTWNSGSFYNYCHSITVGDSDNDGYNELIGGTGSHGSIYVYSCEPDGIPHISVDLSPLSTGDSNCTEIDMYVHCAGEGVGNAQIDLDSSVQGEFSQVQETTLGHYNALFTPSESVGAMQIRILATASKTGYLSSSGYCSIQHTPSDNDGDGVPDSEDAFPNDPAAAVDGDNDGYPDEWVPGSTSEDSTTGLIFDSFPDESTQWIDTDGDGFGDNPTGNNSDAFPSDPDEWLDSDDDGVGDNEDTDDDNDGLPDVWEKAYGFDPLNPEDAQDDWDDDGYSNLDEYLHDTDPLNPNSLPGLTVFGLILIIMVIILIFILIALAVIYYVVNKDRQE
jgi:hypothetical protein